MYKIMFLIKIMKSYYDESVFVDCLMFKNMTNELVYVSNSVDRFLLERLNIRTTDICQKANFSPNPVNLCAKVNIYSLKKQHTTNNFFYNHSKIYVVRDTLNKSTVADCTNCVNDFNYKMLELSESSLSIIYEPNNDLTAFEMALLVKFYSFFTAIGPDTDSTDHTTRLQDSVKISVTLCQRQAQS